MPSLTRSPLKRKPLHNPGDSLRQQIDDLLNDKILLYLVAGVLTLAFAFLEWMRWLRPAPPQPILVTVLAVPVIGYCTIRIIQHFRRVRTLRLGLDGEKAVGQFLEDLRQQGCRVFHDIVGKDFNIDHVIVSERGIFVIETKTYSKPLRGTPVAEVVGGRLLFNGRERGRDPIRQALGLRDWLRDLLSEVTGRQLPVKAVIVLPGWFVEPLKGDTRDDLWVLNPKALPSFIANEPILLKREDVALVSSRLIDYITREA